MVVDPRLSGPLKLIVTEGSKLLKVRCCGVVCYAPCLVVSLFTLVLCRSMGLAFSRSCRGATL